MARPGSTQQGRHAQSESTTHRAAVTTERSWTFEKAPTVMWFRSPRSTQPYQTEVWGGEGGRRQRHEHWAAGLQAGKPHAGRADGGCCRAHATPYVCSGTGLCGHDAKMPVHPGTTALPPTSGSHHKRHHEHHHPTRAAPSIPSAQGSPGRTGPHRQQSRHWAPPRCRAPRWAPAGQG